MVEDEEAVQERTRGRAGEGAGIRAGQKCLLFSLSSSESTQSTGQSAEMSEEGARSRVTTRRTGDEVSQYHEQTAEIARVLPAEISGRLEQPRALSSRPVQHETSEMTS